MNIARRLAPLLVLAATGCFSFAGSPPSLRPGSDMVVPKKPTKVEKKNGETCVTVGGVIVKGNSLKCSEFVPDSAKGPPTVKPPQ